MDLSSTLQPPRGGYRYDLFAMAEIDDSTTHLVDLGLTLNEARCYVALLHLGPASAGEIADFSGVPRTKVYATLKSLEQRNFCSASGDRVTTFRAVGPELALSEWIRRREHDRRLADEHDRRLSDELVAILPTTPERTQVDVTDIMELTGGRVHTSEVLDRVLGDAEVRLDIAQAAPVFQPQARWNVAEMAALERGVQVRVLVASRELATEHRYDELMTAGAEVRLTRGVPLKLIIRDDGREAIVALPTPGNGRHPTCVAIRHPELVAPLQLLFNREWRRAQPLAARTMKATRRPQAKRS